MLTFEILPMLVIVILLEVQRVDRGYEHDYDYGHENPRIIKYRRIMGPLSA